jgi:hypothetical protein
MLRKVVCGAVILILCVGVALADEFTASITKVDGNKVTFNKVEGFGGFGGGKGGGRRGQRGEQKKGEEKTLPVADNIKVVKGQFNKETKKMEAGEPIEGGLKNDLFTKIGERGVFATIVTDAKNEKITEIRAFGGGRRGK